MRHILEAVKQTKHSSKKGKDDKVCVFGIVNRNTKQVKQEDFNKILLNLQIKKVNY